MADSVFSTLDKETERLRGKLKGTELASAVKALKTDKIESLNAMAAADGKFGALVDQLAHSGAQDPKRDRVMSFTGSPDPCALCETISAGNPYTIEQATNYGAQAHPNCRDHWERAQWELAPEEVAVMQRRVRDGTVQTWDGSGRTPAPGPARELAQVTNQAPDSFGAVRRYAIRQARRRGVPEDTVNAMLTKKQLAGREKRQAEKVRKAPRGGQHGRLRMFERE